MGKIRISYSLLIPVIALAVLMIFMSESDRQGTATAEEKIAQAEA